MISHVPEVIDGQAALHGESRDVVVHQLFKQLGVHRAHHEVRDPELLHVVDPVVHEIIIVIVRPRDHHHFVSKVLLVNIPYKVMSVPIKL